MISPAAVDAYPRQAGLFADWIEHEDPHRPTRLPGWQVTELAEHVAQTGTVLLGALARDRPAERPLTVGAYLHSYADVAQGIDAGVHKLSARGRPLVEVAAGLRVVAEEVAAAVRDLGHADPVVRGARGPIRAGDLFRTRVLELVVHALDVDDGPTLDRQALGGTVRLLAEVLAEQHPGRNLEVRVPPFAAVQVGEGPAHTRGTPPNVVEAQPETFVAVAAGRRSFTDAVAAGEITASGARADLTPYLPLL